MPAKTKSKPKTVQAIEKLYSNFRKDIEKQKRQRVAVKPKTIVKDYLEKLNQDEALENDRVVLVKKIARIVVRDEDYSSKKSQINVLLEEYYQETRDDEFKILIETLLENMLSFETSLEKYLGLLKTKAKNPKKGKKLTGGNTLYFFKNQLLDIGNKELEDNYADRLEEAIEGVGKELLDEKRKSLSDMRDKFLKKLYYSKRENYQKVIDEYRPSDKSMVQLIEKYDIRARGPIERTDIPLLISTIDKYIDYKIKNKDLNPLEFMNDEYKNKTGSSDQKDQEDEEAGYYENLLNQIKNNAEIKVQEEEEDEGELPEVYTGKKVPVKEIKVIITPEMEEKLGKLYKYTKKELKESVKTKTAVILGVDKSCLELQLYKPWIYKFSSTWITSDEENVIKYSLQEQSTPVEIYDYYGQKYYKANKLFHILQCNYFSKKMKRQNDNVLTLYEDSKTPVNFKVIHLLTNGNIIEQDEQLFNKENKYMENRRLLSESETLLNSNLAENFRIKQIAQRLSKNRLKNSIMKIAEKRNIKVDEEQMEKYVDNIISGINSKRKVRYFLDEVSSILIYLDNRMLADYTNNFQTRLVNMFYRPDKVSNMTISEKFEELFKNPRYPSEIKNKIAQRIIYYKGIITDEISKQIIYELVGRPTKKRYYEKLVEKLDMDIIDIKAQCKNKDILDDSLSEYLVYAEKNTGDLYCISLFNIGDKNPYTGEPYPSSVLKELEKLDKDRVDSYFNLSLFGEGESKELAPKLIEILMQDIQNMEDKLGKDLMEGKNETQICDYCKEHIKDSELKTVVKRGSESKLVNFCRIKCFEEWQVKKSKS